MNEDKMTTFVFIVEDTLTGGVPGELPIGVIAADGIVASGLINLLILAWYVNSVSVAPIVAEEYFTKMNFLFFYWDQMNFKIIPENLNPSTLNSDFESQLVEQPPN